MTGLKIRYDKNGEPESYDPETGKTVGHITTMGNYIKPTKEDEKRRQKEIEEIKKTLGI